MDYLVCAEARKFTRGFLCEIDFFIELPNNCSIHYKTLFYMLWFLSSGVSCLFKPSDRYFVFDTSIHFNLYTISIIGMIDIANELKIFFTVNLIRK